LVLYKPDRMVLSIVQRVLIRNLDLVAIASADATLELVLKPKLTDNSRPQLRIAGGSSL